MSRFSTHKRLIVVSLVIVFAIVALARFGPVSRAEFEPAVFAPVISATMVDALFVDNDADAQFDPGDTIEYTVTVTNSGPDPATGMVFTNTLPGNVTLVPGSTIASPIAAADSFAATGNVQITIAAPGVLTNDIDPTTGTSSGLTVTTLAGDPSSPFVGTSAQGGNVTSSVTNGSFTYNPPPGFTGTDTFTYVVSGATGTSTGTVTFNVSGMLWFVQTGAPAGGDGRLTNPFNCLVGAGCFDAVAVDDPGDNIFLYSGAYTGGLTLLANQRLIGQGATASISTITGITPPTGSLALPATGGARPTVTTVAAATSALTVGSGNTLRGFNIGNTTASDITGTGFGTLTASEIDLNGTGRPLNLTTGTLATTFGTLTSTSSAGGAGINLSGIAGSLTVTGATSITGAATQGISISGSTLDATFGTTTMSGSGSQGILVGTHTLGTLAFGNTTITGGTIGVLFTNNASGSRTFGTLAISGGSNEAFFHSTSGGNVTVTGAATLSSGGDAISVSAPGATNVINFNAATSATRTSVGGNGVNWIGTTGASMTFSALTIQTNAGTGLNATIGGTVTVTNNTGTVNNTSQAAPAIVAANVALNANFASINSSGGTNAVSLTTVTGTCNFGTGALGGSTGATFNVVGGTVSTTYAGNVSQANNAPLVSVSGGHTTGTITFNTGTLSATGGSGLQFNDADSTTSYNFNGTNTLNGGDAGIDIIGGSAGTFNFSSATTITSPNGTAFNVNSGSPTVTYSGSITQNTAGQRLVVVDGTTANSVTFNTGTLTGDNDQTGVSINNVNGNVSFNNLTLGTSGSRMTNQAVTITNGSGTYGLGTVSIFTNAAAGIVSTNADGTLNVTTGTVNSNAGAAVNIDGPGGLTTLSVSLITAQSTGSSTNGIALRDTNGTFTVAGNTAGTCGGQVTVNAVGTANGVAAPNTGDCSGGTISGKSGDGVSLNNVTNVSLTRMLIQNNLNSGIFADDTSNLSVISSFLDNNSDVADPLEANLRFNELLGSCVVTNSTVTGAPDDEIRLTPSSGTLTNLAISGTVIGNDLAGENGNGMTISPTGTATVTVNLTNSVVKDVFAAGIVVNGDGSTTRTFNVSNTSFLDMDGVGISMQGSFNADLNFNISNNTFLRNISNAVNISFGTTATNNLDVLGTISGNAVGNTTIDSGSRDLIGIAMESQGDADTVVFVNNNTIRHTDQQGFFAQSRLDNDADAEVGRFDLILRDNSVNNIDDNTAFPFFSVNGMTVDSRNTSTLCMDSFSNQSTDIGGAGHFSLRNRDTSNFIIERFDDGDGNFNETITNTTVVQNFHNGQNDAGGTTVAILNAPFVGFKESNDNTCRNNPTAGPTLRPNGGDSEPVYTEQDLLLQQDDFDDGWVRVVIPDNMLDRIHQAPARPRVRAPKSDLVETGSIWTGALGFLSASYKSEPEVLAGIETWKRPEVKGQVTESAKAVAGLQVGMAIPDEPNTEAENGSAIAVGTVDVTEIAGPATGETNEGSSLLATVSEIAGKLASAISPTVYSQETERPINDGTKGDIPESGETITVNGSGSGFTLGAGQSVTIRFRATIDAQLNKVITNPSNQGTISGSNFANVLTDDPDVAGTNNPTVTPLDSLATGGTVWNDNGAGGGVFGNGIKDGTEPGVDGVLLSLFVDADDNNVPDIPGSPIATFLTAGGGVYSFASLAPGNYITRVDQDNFDAGGNVSLVGLQVSPITTPEPPDPDTGDPDVDNDDNGARTAGQPAFTNAITLAYNTEPTAGTGNDTNTTVDIGFLSNPPPTILNLGGDISTYTEDGPAVILDDSSAPEVAATVTDDQTNLNGGNLRSSTTVNEVITEDVLGISIAGTVTLSSGTNVGSIVSVGGLAIGTVTANGTGGNDLIVTFNTADATPARISLLMQALTYRNSNLTTPSVLQRTIAVSVFDGLTGTDTENVFVNVVAVNDPSIITGTTTGTVIEAGGVANGTPGTPTATADLLATDPDGVSDSWVAVAPGGATTNGFGTYGLTASGVWTYTLNNSNATVQALNVGGTLNDTFTAATTDGATQVITITINGANDAAVITGVTTGDVTEAGGVANGTPGVPSDSDNLNSTDVDNPADSWTVVAPGAASISGFGTFGVTAAGVWTYTVDDNNASVQALNGAATLTDTFNVTTIDGTAQLVTITIHAQNDAAVITGTATGTVVEAGGVANGTPGTPTATADLLASDPDNTNDAWQAVAPGGATTNGFGTYGLTAAGVWTYTLNNSNATVQALNVGGTLNDTFTVLTTDGTSRVVTITINGSNDAAVITGVATGDVTEAGGVANGTPGVPSDSDNLNSTDIDNPADSWTVVAPGAASISGFGTFGVTAAGVWTYTVDDNNASVQALNGAATLTDTFNVTTIDGTAQLVTITIHAQNDAAVITGTATGTVVEAGGVANGTPGTPTATADLLASDPDNTNDSWQAVAPGGATTNGFGTYGVTAAGVWTYTLNNSNATVQALNVGGTLNDTFTVLTADGTSRVVTITINGANDAAVITGVATGDVTEAGGVANGTPGVPSDSDNLNSTDVDNPADSWTVVAPGAASISGFGTFGVTAAGVWTYTVDDNNASVQALNGAATLTDTFNVTTIDGTAQLVTITIHAQNDAATITGTATGTVVEASGVANGTPGTPTASADLLASDVDNTNDAWQAVAPGGATTNGFGTYGLTAAGVWTYTLDNNNATVQALNTGGTLSDTFTVLTADGTSRVVTITINGANDAAVITGVTTGDVTEAGGVANGTPGVPTDSDNLNSTDVDNPADSWTVVAPGGATANGFGTYAVTAAGVWTYTIDDNNATVQALNGAATLTDTFNALTIDGTSQTVTITIHAQNDAATITGTATGTVVEASGVANGTPGTPTASADLLAADVDNTADTWQAVAPGGATTNGFGTYGLTAAGVWTYTLDNNNATVQALNTGGTLNDTFTVLTADGTSQLITITINGANDAAVITGVSTGNVTEAGGVNNGTPGIPSDSDNLDSVDVDNPPNDVWQAVAPGGATTNGYGSYALTAAGVWTYTLDDTDPAVQALNGAATLSDTFTAVTVDGTSQVVTITIAAQNDNSILDLDIDNSSGAVGADYTVQFVPLGSAVPVTDTDVSLMDIDNTTFASATFTVTNVAANDVLAVNGALPGNIVASAFNTGTGVLTLSSAGATATTAQWIAAVHQVEFLNTSALPNPTTRDITVVINDGTGNSNTAHTFVTIPTEPSIQFSSVAYVEDESQTASITVTRTGLLSGTDSVTFGTLPSTATGGAACTPGVDYITVTGQTVTFIPGDNQETVNVVVCADMLNEPNQTVNLVLTGPFTGLPNPALLNINDTASQYKNAAPITIDNGAPPVPEVTAPYPSSIVVAGAPVVIGSMRVTLYDYSHSIPDNVDVLLVGPGGGVRNMVLMADAGGAGPQGQVTLSFTDAGSAVLPDSGPLTTGNREPTSWVTPVANFPGPAPAGPYNEPGSTLGGSGTQTLFGNFGLTDPNGTWSLYIRQDGGGAGVVAGGWGIEFLVPTAADASITGRVLMSDGRPIRNAKVVISGNSLPATRVATTGTFGYYTFEGLRTGETYVVTVNSRRFTFQVPSRIVHLTDNLADVDFIAYTPEASQ